MRKEKFVYNTQTLRYEKVEDPLKVKILRVLGFFSAVILAAFVILSVAYSYFPSPKEKALMREIDQMELKYASFNKEITVISKVLENVQERDAHVHRLVFGMEPIDKDVWNGGIGGHDKFGDLTNFKNSGELLMSTQALVEKLKRQIVIQSTSLDEISKLAADKEEMLASIPAIKPVRSDKLKRNIRSLSGFGMRMHPIYKRRKMHTGIDFTSPNGTPIQATGNGKVLKIERKKHGYGNSVIIDHGFGYKTRYGHMNTVDVKRGQKVTRGQLIGTVGSTGTSTAPHLHYEVIYKGKKVNPIHYCMDGLTPEEYQELANLASISNQSLD